MIETPADIIIKDQPLEQSARRTVQSLLTRILGLYEAMYDRFGTEGLDLIRGVSTEYGKNIGIRARRGGDEWSMDDVGKFLVKVFGNVYAEGKIDRWDKERIEIRVNRCPYPFRSDEICNAHTSMEEEMVRGLNPNLVYEVTKSIPRGDEYFLHVLRHV
jgi:hypothetical protein